MNRSATALNGDETIDLRKLIEEARRQWYIDSGRKADRLLYEEFCRLIDRDQESKNDRRRRKGTLVPDGASSAQRHHARSRRIP